jgi:hypothetical protein
MTTAPQNYPYFVVPEEAIPKIAMAREGCVVVPDFNHTTGAVFAIKTDDKQTEQDAPLFVKISKILQFSEDKKRVVFFKTIKHLFPIHQSLI